MLKFKIFEIPEGQSKRSVQLGNEDLELGELPFKGGTIEIEFSRTIQFVRAKLHINAFVEVICDRSLDAFDYEVDKTYEVLFKAEQVEESADENGAIRNYDHKSKQIDLEQDVRDTLLLELPVKKLHPRFLDQDGNPIEYFNQNFGDIPEEDDDKIDPRWEVLKELKN